MEEFLYELSIVLVGAAVLSFIAVLLKQPIIIAYIVCGVVIGPWGLGWIKNAEFIDAASQIGVTLLLFLAGLCLHPQKLISLFKKTSMPTLVNCVVSFVLAFDIALLFRFGIKDSVFIGLALMFSSTILTIKLLPTNTLHQQRMGGVCISVLILQDILAVMVLALVRFLDSLNGSPLIFSLLVVRLIAFVAVLFLFEQFVLRKIMHKVERLQEILFILSLAWCFGIAAVSNRIGLFFETGAFFAGVAIARHPISLFISEKLKPLRDFFLVLFFFTLGARLNIVEMKEIFRLALFMAAMFLIIKPWLFKKTFILIGEKPDFSNQIGFRLGQLSEFSLLIATMAYMTGQITSKASQLIQLVTILTFVVSSYVVVLKFPTPIGISKLLKRD